MVVKPVVLGIINTDLGEAIFIGKRVDEINITGLQKLNFQIAFNLGFKIVMERAAPSCECQA